MSLGKFKIKQSPEKKHTTAERRLAAPDVFKLLSNPHKEVSSAPTADSIECDEDDVSPAEPPAQSPKTPASTSTRQPSTSPSTAPSKSAQRSFLATISDGWAYKPQDKTFQRLANRTAGDSNGSISARAGGMPVQSVIDAPLQGSQTFVISSSQAEAGILKCLCSLLGAESAEESILLLKGSLCRQLDTSPGAILTISPPWSELRVVSGSSRVLIPWSLCTSAESSIDLQA